VKTDAKRLQQVLLNLLSNAIKFTDRNGKIQVIVEKLENGFIRLSVVDNGKGIKVKNQDKLFKLFCSFKDENKKINTNGIGLGLVISKLIVNKFNGYIDFVSKYKKGSTFFYTFEIQPHS
jgi:signal transduction histidine kinase